MTPRAFVEMKNVLKIRTNQTLFEIVLKMKKIVLIFVDYVKFNKN